MPKIGSHYQYAFYNFYKAQKLRYTGDQNLYGDIGFDIYYKNLAFSAVVTPTLVNWYNWVGEPFEHYSLETGIYCSFSNIISHKKARQNEPPKQL